MNIVRMVMFGEVALGWLGFAMAGQGWSRLGNCLADSEILEEI